MAGGAVKYKHAPSDFYMLIDNREIIMAEKMETTRDPVILRGVNLTKTFPGVKALDNVSIEVRRGEVLGICGENGAGKSTLMKLFSGVYRPDSGRLEYDGQEVCFKTPAEGIQAGISTIHQELSYISDLTIAENIFLERRPEKHGLIDWGKMYTEADELLRSFGLKVSSRMKIKELPTATKQMIEIIRAVSVNAKVLIMDEPTSSLGIDDTEKLLNTIREVKESGIAVILISHRLEELFEICDRLVVLRDGQFVREFDRDNMDKVEVVTAMIGRRLTQLYAKKDIRLGDVVLELNNVRSHDLHNVSFQVRAGEIVGLYGMVGAGQDEIANAIFGLKSDLSGDIILNGEKLKLKSPKDAVDCGIAYLTAERKQDGLILSHSIRENVVLASIGNIHKGALAFQKPENIIANRWKQELGIKAVDVDTKVETLSGGNQQKVVLAKWLETHPKVLVMNEPTRGVDIGAKQEMYAIIQDLCAKGMAVVMITSDMPEMLNLADTIYTVCDGRITAKYSSEEATQYKLMISAIGMEDEK